MAVKSLVVDEAKDDADSVLSEFFLEVGLLHPLRHPNIVMLLCAVCSPPQLMMVLELASEGALDAALQDATRSLHGTGYWPTALGIATDVARGVAFLHQLTPMIVHRDLKPANVLLFEGWRAKITE